jgi:succinoglycan biosynthesis protein ExoA
MGVSMYRTPELSVIMPVRNEIAHIGSVLDQLLDQSLAPERFEVIVVDGMSTDGTRALVHDYGRRDPRVRLLDNPRYLAGSARNIGVRNARAPHVIFVDGHCRIASERMLETALEAFGRGERCLSRPQPLYGDATNVYSTAVSLVRGTRLGHHAGSRIFSDKDQHCSPVSAGCAYTRELYLEVGGTDEDFDAGEDLELNYRVKQLGVSAFHCHGLTVAYCARSSVAALFRQLYRYGFGRARLARKHTEAASMPAVGLGFAMLGFLVLPALGVAWVPAWRLWLLGIALYLLVVGSVSARLAGKHGWHLFGPLLLCFPAIHAGAGLGFLAGLTGGPSWTHAPKLRSAQVLMWTCLLPGSETSCF